MKKKIYRVYTDGSCRPKNPGGGYSACILVNKLSDTVICKTNVLGYSTNNRAEMQGVISALEILSEKEVDQIKLHTDSQLCYNIVKGLLNPKDRQNLKANKDLIKQMRILINDLKKKNVYIQIVWVKRNSSTEMIYADFLASTTSTTWIEEQTLQEFEKNITKEMEKNDR